MISHQSPYGQVLMFSSEYYYSLSDEKLSEIEENCANIDREVVIINKSPFRNFSIDEENEENEKD